VSTTETPTVLYLAADGTVHLTPKDRDEYDARPGAALYAEADRLRADRELHGDGSALRREDAPMGQRAGMSPSRR
jgi:hypothetical protein